MSKQMEVFCKTKLIPFIENLSEYKIHISSLNNPSKVDIQKLQILEEIIDDYEKQIEDFETELKRKEELEIERERRREEKLNSIRNEEINPEEWEFDTSVIELIKIIATNMAEERETSWYKVEKNCDEWNNDVIIINI